MSAGMYVSASGALTSMHRLDVASNNLANVNTTAFKRDFAYQTPRLPERLEDSLYHLGSDELLDQLAGGVLNGETRTDFSMGPIEITNNPLDVAIDGEGFFVTEAADGSGDTWLTRDGRFTLAPDGALVSASTGSPILSDANAPIRVDPTLPVAISARGEVMQEGRAVGHIQIAGVDDTRMLKKTVDGFYASKFGGQLNHEPIADARLHVEAVEGSSVDPIKALMSVTAAGSGVRNNLRLMQLYDELNNRAINRLGSVTG